MRSIFKIITSLLVFQSLVFGVGTQFLAIPHNSMELVLGVNPTINLIATKPMLTASYGNWLGEIKVSSFGYNRKAYGGSTGLDVRYIALNDIELRSERPTDEPLAVYGATAIALDGKYNRLIPKGIIGIKIRYISLQLFDESSTGYAMDIGLQHNINKKFTIGFSLLNFGKMSKLYKEEPKLPIRMIAGSTYNFSINEVNYSNYIALEKSTLTDGMILRVGEVIKWNKLQLLIGTQFSDNTASISGGFGIKLGSYQIGYAIQYGSQLLGIPQIVDISVILP